MKNRESAEPVHNSGVFAPINELGRIRVLLQRCAPKVSPNYQGKFDESDLIQQTLVEAHENRDAFRGKSEAELTGWLQRMLSRNFLDAVRRLRSQKRNIAIEQQTRRRSDLSGDGSKIQLTAEHTSPSGKAMLQEDLLRMKNAIGLLPDAQREALTLHHLQGMTLAEVSSRMNRTAPAIAGLLHRGLQALKREMGT